MENISTEKEIWKDVVGYEGYYQVSNLARVKSLARELKSNGNLKYVGDLADFDKTYIKPEKILSQNKSKDGYLRCIFSKNGKPKMQRVHRLVAQAFIPNPNNMPVVNHIDEDKTNNLPGNLEWVSVAYNNVYGTRIQRLKNSEGFKRNSEKNCKPLSQYDLNGNLIASFNSLKEAVESNNGYKKSGMSHCLVGRNETYKGFIWKYDKNKQLLK